MRYADIALLIIPAALLVAWFAGVRGLSMRGIGLAFAALIGLGGALALLGHERAFHGSYQPARLQNGRVQQPLPPGP